MKSTRRNVLKSLMCAAVLGASAAVGRKPRLKRHPYYEILSPDGELWVWHDKLFPPHRLIQAGGRTVDPDGQEWGSMHYDMQIETDSVLMALVDRDMAYSGSPCSPWFMPASVLPTE